jgi:hypothetical protein
VNYLNKHDSQEWITFNKKGLGARDNFESRESIDTLVAL